MVMHHTMFNLIIWLSYYKFFAIVVYTVLMTRHEALTDLLTHTQELGSVS